MDKKKKDLGAELGNLACPCPAPPGSTHLSSSGCPDPCGTLGLITFTFKQTALRNQSAMGADGRPEVRRLVEKTDWVIKLLFIFLADKRLCPNITTALFLFLGRPSIDRIGSLNYYSFLLTATRSRQTVTSHRVVQNIFKV